MYNLELSLHIILPVTQRVHILSVYSLYVTVTVIYFIIESPFVGIFHYKLQDACVQ